MSFCGVFRNHNANIIHGVGCNVRICPFLSVNVPFCLILSVLEEL
jgi:hypothetical protein